MDLSKFGVDVKEGKSIRVEDQKLEFDLDEMKRDFSFEEIERFLPWFLKYRLKGFDDLILTFEIKKIVDFFENFKMGRGLLLHGPAGSGKTTTLNLIGEKLGYEIFEVNASDNRNKASIGSTIGDVVKQRSLFGKEKLILVDEVDGVAGREDRGGVLEIVKILKSSRYPMVFAANDIEDDKIKSLKKQCVVIDFANSSKSLLLGIGERIFKSEKIGYKTSELEEFIERRSISDIRGFINDLQASVFEGKFFLNDDLEIRDYKKKIETVLNKIYFSYPEDSLKGGFNSEVNLDDLFLYLEENTPGTYSKFALINAFNEISKADIFKGRIMKWQHWRFLVYVNFYLTYGVSSVKGQPKKITYKRNQRILKKWIYGNVVNSLRPQTKAEKASNMDPKFIEKLAKHYGCSAKRCRSRDVYYFAFAYKRDKDFAKSMDGKFLIDDAIRKALFNL